VPTARELLEQADALMRKNRGRVGSDIPILTDAVPATPSPSPSHLPVADIPVLTEIVEEVIVSVPSPDPTAAEGAMFEGDPSDWLVMDTIDPAYHSVTGNAPDTLAVVPPVTLKAAEPLSESPPAEAEEPARATLKAAGSAATPPPARSNAPEPEVEPAADEYPLPLELSAPVAVAHHHADADPATASEERWNALAEQISMQVLQRIDLFTDTGLKEQLARQLQPIVDRASAELVGEINDHVGKLVRSYVAEAIEREIAQWRSDHR
jgi:hypothetical protein